MNVPCDSSLSCTSSVPALIAMCRDHESLNLQQFEGLMALTNLASLDNVKSRIVAEKGISCFQYLQVQYRRASVWFAQLQLTLVFALLYTLPTYSVLYFSSSRFRLWWSRRTPSPCL